MKLKLTCSFLVSLLSKTLTGTCLVFTSCTYKYNRYMPSSNFAKRFKNYESCPSQVSWKVKLKCHCFPVCHAYSVCFVCKTHLSCLLYVYCPFVSLSERICAQCRVDQSVRKVCIELLHSAAKKIGNKEGPKIIGHLQWLILDIRKPF